ncbi:MAG TPA: serine hydrolase domain-containing protein [Verrucomicrobiales bacterium]|nr:serine hydrolase domain-containing protein [Verrucomicrobiales bacterium]
MKFSLLLGRIAAGALLCASLLPGRVLAEAPPAADVSQVDAEIQAEMERQHIPGLALAVVKDGKVIKAAGYGFAELEQQTKVRPETVFRISSISKQFIAAGIVLLARDGKLKLEDKVSAYLDGTPDTWKDITLRHLLSHTSGLARECPAFDGWKPVSDAIAVKSAYALPLEFPTGSKYQYCNTGYFALAEIITRQTGMPWGDFLTARVFKPAGLSATRTTSIIDVIPGRARGYEWVKDAWKNVPEPPALRPSGAFLSTVLDLAKWDADLLAGKTLTIAEQEEMRTPMKLSDGKACSYGLGWQITAFQGHPQASHGGSNPGYRSHYLRLLDCRLSVIVLTNSENANPKLIAEQVAARYV